MKIAYLFILLSTSCGPKEKSTPPNYEFTFCEFYTDGACVIKYNDNIDIDPEVLSKYLGLMEYEVDYYYPGLNFEALAQENNLKIIYRWADNFTTYQGEYKDYETTAYISLRRGENVTPKMECTDRYFIAVHEVLHFIVKRYIKFDDSGDAHDIPYIFTRWALLNDMPDCTVEGRLYTLIARYCFEQ